MQDVPKIVRQQLEASKPAVAESHPDADLLTAFAEQALVGRERELVIDHLAHCGDCRDVVVLALPATEAVAVPAASGARIAWLSWPVLRWGVVAAGLLIVTWVGVLQYRQRHRERTIAMQPRAPRLRMRRSFRQFLHRQRRFLNPEWPKTRLKQVPWLHPPRPYCRSARLRRERARSSANRSR